MDNTYLIKINNDVVKIASAIAYNKDGTPNTFVTANKSIYYTNDISDIFGVKFVTYYKGNDLSKDLLEWLS